MGDQKGDDDVEDEEKWAPSRRDLVSSGVTMQLDDGDHCVFEWTGSLALTSRLSAKGAGSDGSDGKVEKKW